MPSGYLDNANRRAQSPPKGGNVVGNNVTYARKKPVGVATHYYERGPMPVALTPHEPDRYSDGPSRHSPQQPAKGSPSNVPAGRPETSPEMLLVEMERTLQELEKTKAELAEQEEETRKIRSEWKKAATEVMQTQTETLRPLTDERLQSLWNEADYKLSHWAHQYFSVPCKLAGFFGKGPSTGLSATCSNFSDCVVHPSLRWRIIQAHMWERLRKDLFQGSMMYLGEDGANAFAVLRKRIIEGQELDQKRLQTWHATTASLISPMRRDRHRQLWVDKQIIKISKQIKPYTPSETWNSRIEDFGSIVQDLVDLDIELQSQRALYFVRAAWYPRQVVGLDGNALRFGMLVDESTMDSGSSTAQSGRTLVALVVTPTVWKRGTQSGKDYDKETPVCKAHVISYEEWHDHIRNDEEKKTTRKESGGSQKQGYFSPWRSPAV